MKVAGRQAAKVSPLEIPAVIHVYWRPDGLVIVGCSMQNISFPWLALGLGLAVAIGLMLSGVFSPDGSYKLPLLTMLIVNEFGFFVTAIGAGIGINTLLGKGMNPAMLGITLADGLMAAMFLYLGIQLWPGGFSF